MYAFMAATVRANRALFSYHRHPFDEIVSPFILQLTTDTLVAILILMTIWNSAGSLSR